MKNSKSLINAKTKFEKNTSYLLLLGLPLQFFSYKRSYQ